jgi:hypothetical protein
LEWVPVCGLQSDKYYDRNGKYFVNADNDEDQEKIDRIIERMRESKTGSAIVDFIENSPKPVEISFESTGDVEKTGLTIPNATKTLNGKYELKGVTVILDEENDNYDELRVPAHEFWHTFQLLENPQRTLRTAEEDDGLKETKKRLETGDPDYGDEGAYVMGDSIVKDILKAEDIEKSIQDGIDESLKRCMVNDDSYLINGEY